MIYRWRDKFYAGGKAALAFEGRSGSGGEKAALECQVAEFQKLIGEQAVGDLFLKAAVEELKPSWVEVQGARVAEGLTVKKAMKPLGLSRMGCYRVLKSPGLIQPKRMRHNLRSLILVPRGAGGKNDSVRI